MTNRTVLAHFGDDESSATIARLRASEDTEVIAVVFEFGRGSTLAQLKDTALAAGAGKCHALDVREEFARDVTVRALRESSLTDLSTRIASWADRFVADKLHEIGTIEQADVVLASVPPAAVGGQPHRFVSPGPAYLDLRFADEEPVALNDVPMSLTELIESVETITGLPALDVLRVAYQELGHARDGQVVLRAHEGDCRATVAAAV